MKKTYPRNSISTLLLIICIIFFVLLILLATLLYHFTYNFVKSNIIDTNNKKIDQVEYLIQDHVKSIEKLASNFTFNYPLQEFVNSKTPSQRKEHLNNIKNLISINLNVHPYLKDIYFSVANSDLIYRQLDWEAVFDNYQSYQKLIQSKASITPFIKGRKSFLYAATAPVYNLSKIKDTFGTCYFIFTSKYLDDIIIENSSEYSITYLIDSNNRIISSTNENEIGLFLNDQYDLDFTSQYDMTQPIKSNNKKFLLQNKPLTHTEWTLVYITPYENLVSSLKDMKTSIQLLIGAVLFISCMLFAYIFKIMFLSFKTLINHMKQIEQGDLTAKISPNYYKEFITISQHFNQMMTKTLDLTNNNALIQQSLYEEQLAHQQASIDALQSQINPHFLYNTLDCIKSMGYYYQAKPIADMTIALSAIFRYSIKGDHVVTVQQELDCLQHYLFIQNTRFEDKFETSLDINQACKSITMLKFLLQPLVENAIFHGIEPASHPCFLNIIIRQQNHFLLIIVKDNGVGMDKYTLDKLKNKLTHSLPDSIHHQSLGLINIHNRVRLFYGSHCGLDISSQQHIGTTIKLKLGLLEDKQC